MDIDFVYKTVLLILNKEQRGYMTPDEFNKTAAQVQLEIFEKYFEDLNQFLRVPESNNEYADRIRTLEDKIAMFEERQALTFSSGSFTLSLGAPPIHRLGVVQYEPLNANPVEIQQCTRREYTEAKLSPLTQPSKHFPMLVKRQSIYTIYPSSIQDSVWAYYVRKPDNPFWNYTVSTINGAFLHSPTGSVDFQISDIEQTEVVLKILLYAGVIIRDPQVIQTAAAMVAEENQQEKL